MLTGVVTLPPQAQGLTSGLLGVMDGNPDNDFTLPNGTVLSPNISASEIFYDFGKACKCSAIISLDIIYHIDVDMK